MKIKILLLTVLAVVIFIGSYTIYGDRKEEIKKSREEIGLSAVASGADSVYNQSAGENNRSDPEDSYGVIGCYICGEVVSPGVYEVKEGSRINELLNMAGGFTEDASISSVNLAAFLSDGDMIYIPAEGEENVGSFVAGSASAGGIININKAGTEELATLPGIGETKAKAIVSYRNEKGAFKSTDELMNVSGIGQNTYESLKDYITV